jgi:hypothetical protein
MLGFTAPIVRLFALLLLMACLLACSSQSKRIEELSTSPEPAAAAQTVDEVRVLDSGFVWDGETISYAFTAENSSEDVSLEGVAIQINVYDQTGEAVAGDTGVIDFILPKQVVAYAAHLPLEVQPDRIAMSFTVEQQASVENARVFERIPGKFEATNFGGRVVAAVRNPYERELRRLAVVAVLRNEDGSIMTGGSGVLELLPPQAESVVTVDILGNLEREPATVDVYTMFSAETVFRLQ